MKGWGGWIRLNDKYYYRIYSERLIINIKIILIYLYCRNVYRIWMKGVGRVDRFLMDGVNRILFY